MTDNSSRVDGVDSSGKVARERDEVLSEALKGEVCDVEAFGELLLVCTRLAELAPQLAANGEQILSQSRALVLC